MAKRKIRSVVIEDHRDGQGGGLQEDAEALDRIVVPRPGGAVEPRGIEHPEPDGAAVIEDKGGKQSPR